MLTTLGPALRNNKLFVTKSVVAKTAANRVWWRLGRRFSIWWQGSHSSEFLSHSWKVQLSLLCEKLICILSIFFSTIFMVALFLNFSIDLPCSPPVGQYRTSRKSYSEVPSYEFYDDIGTHFLMIFDEKNLHRGRRNAHNLKCLCDMLISIYATL